MEKLTIDRGIEPFIITNGTLNHGFTNRLDTFHDKGREIGQVAIENIFRGVVQVLRLDTHLLAESFDKSTGDRGIVTLSFATQEGIES